MHRYAKTVANDDGKTDHLITKSVVCVACQVKHSDPRLPADTEKEHMKVGQLHSMHTPLAQTNRVLSDLCLQFMSCQLHHLPLIPLLLSYVFFILELKFGGYLVSKKGHLSFEALYGPDNETVIEKAKKDFLESLKLAIEKSPLKNTLLDISEPKISAYALWAWVEAMVTFDPIQLNRIDDKLDTNLGTAIIQDIVNEEIQKLDCAVVQLFELSDEIVVEFNEKRRKIDMSR
ncbi:unnamed protein product [Calicophoron daubneyi]|uniref:Uncharacterized protein n=1 Tax=Calicophoron daubneyi TaxID=300641 RepID=A0AAV2TA02_CALDB